MGRRKCSLLVSFDFFFFEHVGDDKISLFRGAIAQLFLLQMVQFFRVLAGYG